MKNERGFSLIELIVVIAILSIISVGVVSAFLSLNGWGVTQTISDIEGSLKETKILAMSKSNATLTLSRENDVFYIMVTGEQKKKIGSVPIQITYTTTATADTASQNVVLVNGKSITLGFNRGSGAFLPIATDASGSIYCSDITVARGSKEKNMKLIYVTGKHYIE